LTSRGAARRERPTTPLTASSANRSWKRRGPEARRQAGVAGQPSLSPGVDIVRKTLGRYEIATG